MAIHRSSTDLFPYLKYEPISDFSKTDSSTRTSSRRCTDRASYAVSKIKI